VIDTLSINAFRHYYSVLAQGLSIWKLCASCTYPKHENCDKCVNSGPENRSSLPIGLEMQTWMRLIQTLNYFIWYIFDLKKITVETLTLVRMHGLLYMWRLAFVAWE
jgi:hypothetical protein